MKRGFIAILCTCALTMAACAGDGTVNAGKLPEKARQFIDRHFPGVPVKTVKLDHDAMSKEYDVTLKDGRKIEFDSTGEWTEIECKNSAVPEGIIPAKILAKLKADYADYLPVKQIEKTKNGLWKVELGKNRTELTFDKDLDLKVIDMD